MPRIRFGTTGVFALAVALSLSAAQPAQAFFVHVPQALKDYFARFEQPSAFAQDGGTFTPPSGDSGSGSGSFSPPPAGDQSGSGSFSPPPSGDQQMRPNIGDQGTQFGNPGPGFPSGDMGQKPFGDQGQRPFDDGGRGMPGGQQGIDQGPDAQLKREQEQLRRLEQGLPAISPDQNRGPGGQQGQFGGQQGFQGDNRGPGGHGGPGGPGDPGGQGNFGGGPSLKDVQRSARQVDSQLRQLDSMTKQAGKKGIKLPDDFVEKLQRVKDASAAIKSAKTDEEAQGIDQNELFSGLQELEETRREVFEKQQQFDGMRRGMKGLDQGMKQFESQLARLKKQKVAVPAEIQEKVDAVKTIVTCVKTATDMDAAQECGMEELQDKMMEMDQSREQLEMLSRWPQMQKQMKTEVTRLDRELKRAKTITANLLKKNIDVSATLAEFESAVGQLKTVQSDIIAKVNDGDAQSAMDSMQEDFFGQMEDVWEHHKVIMTMSNLGRFASEYKRELAQGQQLIKQLKRKKIDTAELEEAFNQAKAKGEEILATLKTKDFDADTVIASLEELENLGQAFEEKAGELSGVENDDDRPWEKGPRQFNTPTLSNDIQQFIPRREVVEDQVPQLAPGTTATGVIAP